MKKLTYSSMAAARLRANKRQYVSLVLGIFLAIFLVTTLFLAAQGFILAQAEQTNKNVGKLDAFLLDEPDISDEALKIAKENAAANGLTGKVSVVKADCREPAPAFLGKFDIIVSNPHYITAAEIEALDTSVKDYEPSLALYGGDDGLDFYRYICKNYRDALNEGGCLCLEFGMGQESAVEAILKENNFGDLQFSRDTSNIIRAVLARKNRKE